MCIRDSTILNKPDEITDEECMPLPVCVCRDSEDLPLIISCWEPTPEEWDALRKQGRIYIAIVSEEYHPPLIVFPGNPFDQASEQPPTNQIGAILDDPYTDDPATVTPERIADINEAILNLDNQQAPLKHPVQPTITDQHGVLRFKANAIIRHLIDYGSISLNDIAVMNFDNDDRQQLAQLIGYSVDGYADLSFHDPSIVTEIDTHE